MNEREKITLWLTCVSVASGTGTPTHIALVYTHSLCKLITAISKNNLTLSFCTCSAGNMKEKNVSALCGDVLGCAESSNT